MTQETAPDNPSYGALAALWVPPAFERLVGTLVHGAGDAALGAAGFSAQTQPHDTKDLRRLVGDLRDLLDVFCFAYPKKGGDVWSQIRKDLGSGYRRVGAFKDLFDSQEVAGPDDARYDRAEVQALRRSILEWKRGLLTRSQGYADYLSKPRTDQVVERQGGELAPFFWGALGARSEPVCDERGRYGGRENLDRLLRKLCQRLAPDVDKATRSAGEGGVGEVAGTKPRHEENREAFHQLRKRMRAIVKLHGRFPLRPCGGLDPAALVAAVERFVVALGDLNNTLLAYERATRTAERQLLAERIHERWSELKRGLRSEDLSGTLLALGRLARPRPR